MPYRSLSVELRPPLALVRIHGGTLDNQAAAEIDRAAEAINDDQHVHVAVLAFDGPVTPGDVTTTTIPLRWLEMMAQPVIACIEGACDDAMLAVALACDIRIADTDATFAVGNAASLGVAERLPRLIGAVHAAEMLRPGARVDADAALASGLVNEVVPSGEAQRRAEEIAATIASRGPIAVRYAKEALRDGLEMPLEQALRYETDITIILQTTADRAEGVAAFIEKREPKFGGR
jgi:enoyl-CoA hydratase/carnithine racemase